MDFLYSLAYVALAGVVYGLVDRMIRNLDGYVYVRSVIILITVLAGILDYFLNWTGVARVIGESFITMLAILFILPMYLLVKIIFYALDPPVYRPPESRSGKLDE